MANASTERPPAQAAVLQLFERSIPRIVDLQKVRELVADFSKRSSGALRDVSSLEAAVELDGFDQVPGSDALQYAAHAIAITGFVPEWNDRALVYFDRILLFRLLDAMYGGDANARSEAPDRPLTGLERSLAINVAVAIMSQLQVALTELSRFTFKSPRCVDDDTPPMIPKAGTDYIVVQLRIDDFDDRIGIVVPAIVFELIRDRLTANENEDEPDLYPVWSQEFKRVVSATNVPIVAVAEGPSMLLSDVAQLKPGAMLEFNGESLRRVRLECEDRPIFVGRLGQSKGVFTVYVEAPVSPDGFADEQE
ncbi:MAG: FliM/FliN family flagellar motor switch protein [Hyphomicrobiaceae bacterium]